MNCPILYTNDYSEITEAYLLLLSNYKDSIKSEIIANGNYWSERLTGNKWY